MRFKKMLVASVACMALTAVAANPAQAALHWNVAGSTLVGSEVVNISGGTWTFSTTVSGTSVELTAENVACSGTCTISGAGESAGRLKFTNVRVVKPASSPPCTVSNPGGGSGTILTEPLKDQIIMDPTVGSAVVFDRFTPLAGHPFVELEFHGCLFSEIPVEGSLTGQSPNLTGVEKVTQELTFSSAAQSTGGGGLAVGGSIAILTGTANNKLSGTNVGKVFGATE